MSTKEDLGRLGGFARYKDVDGDGVGYRTLPGTHHPAAAYFTRGSGHNEQANTANAPRTTENMERLRESSRMRAQLVPAPVLETMARREIGIIALRQSHCALTESRDQFRTSTACDADYLRIGPTRSRMRSSTSFVSQARLRGGAEPGRPDVSLSEARSPQINVVPKLRSVRHYMDGLPMDARSVTDEYCCKEGK